MQAYGKQRASSDLKDRWQAHCIEVLLGKYHAMRVAYLDVSSASVLIRSSRDGSGGIEEVYRVRLPLNPYNGGRGVVVGEGKPENQNHANIFAFGEALQTIDMNQDGCLAEALKTRNLLSVRPLTQQRSAAPPAQAVSSDGRRAFSHVLPALSLTSCACGS